MENSTKDPVQQDDQLTDFTIQMRVIHCAVLSPYKGSWNYGLASVSAYKTSDNFTTLAFKEFFFFMFDSYDNISAIFIFGTKITANIAEKSCYIIIQF